MQQSKSGSRIIETAFVSRIQSSLEDLDEVDRLANHPVLRPNSHHDFNGKLKKSRSEMGGSVGRGLSLWTQSSSARPVSKSVQNSPVTPSHFGCRTVGVAMMIASNRRSNDDIVSVSRSPSISVNSERAGSRICQKPTHRNRHIVTAVIETSCNDRRSCITPPADLARASQIKNETPPNTAPLPTKFARETSSSRLDNTFAGHHYRQHFCEQTKHSGTKERLPSSLVTRLQLQNLSSSISVSSSNESTPQKRPPLPLKPKLSSQIRSKNLKTDPLSTNKNFGSRDEELSAKQDSQPDTKKNLTSKFYNSRFESESCSSAVSSLDSVCSGSSEGLASSSRSNSDLSSSTQSSSRPNIPPKSLIAKFQVLSPISDKSQEQSSEHGDSSRTPKISPTDHILACCGANTSNEEENANETNSTYTKNIMNNNNSNEAETRPAPFLMPKLQRRLREQQQLQKRSNEAHGSDSGISMASQDVVDIYELLQLPFDMPKLRRKTDYIIGQTRPQSVPNRNQNFLDLTSKSSNARSTLETCMKSQNLCNEKRFSLNLNNESSVTNQKEEISNASEDFTTLAPPPPGFVDDTNQYYLPDEAEDDVSAAINDAVLHHPLTERRNRPKMTLNFDINPKEKSLMFATNSPFGLIDCEEINPNLPLDRQEWYHGSITRQEAEHILKVEKEGSYLVRNVDSSRQEYALSVKSARGYMHMRIRRDPYNRDFQLSDFDRRFLTIPEMIHHYTRNRLPIKGAEHMCLKKPLAINLL